MQRKLFRWAILYPALAVLLAAMVSADPRRPAPDPDDTLEKIVRAVLEAGQLWFPFLLRTFLWPGKTLTGWAWESAANDQAAIMVLISYVVWAAIIPTVMTSLGLWDWFAARRKRKSLSQEVNRWWTEFRDWYEEVRWFGRGATAKWATMSDMKVFRWRRGDVFLGRPWTMFGGLSWPVGVSTEKHMVTIAQTGAGKSTAALIPNLCLHEGSLLCLDAKGELARITANKRGRRVGQTVWVLDPMGITGMNNTASYNPFDEMALVAARNPDLAVSYAARIAEALVKPMSTTDSYWDKAAKTLLSGLILYVFTHEPEERRTLLRLRELLTEGDVEAYEAAEAEGLIERQSMNPFDFLIEKMKSVRNGPNGGAIARAASSISMMGDGQRGSVLTTAQEHTAFIDNPAMARVLQSGKDRKLRLNDLKEGKQSIYVCLPVDAVNGPEGRWLRLFVLLFIGVMMTEPERAPNPPVLLAIDEFPSLGRLDGIEVIAPMMRSFGVRFWAVGQDVSQFRDVYPDTWTGFIGGAEAVQFMGLTHPPTIEMLVDMLGQHQVREGGIGANSWRATHPLMDRDQATRFLSKARKNQIIWFGSRRPMKLKVCPYYEYMMPWYYDPDSRYRESLWRRTLRWMKG